MRGRGAWQDGETEMPLKQTEQGVVTNKVMEIWKIPITDMGFYSRRNERRNCRVCSSRVTLSNLSFQRIEIYTLAAVLRVN